MISDAFDMALVDDVWLEVDCKMITVNHGANIDIGANASTEEAGEKLEDGQQLVNDVIHSFGLIETAFDKSSYKTYIRGHTNRPCRVRYVRDSTAVLCLNFLTSILVGYLKNVKKYLEDSGAPPEEIKTFQAGAQRVLTTKFGNEMFEGNGSWKFYIGESMNVDGMVVLHNYKGDEGDIAGYLVFWKHGLKGEKV
ncbi:unnamed protein product [Tuber aestivum]|uniref:Translationally-controlled tumor protein homolog n=1 Tax=Tuber aestivum TaxID=59557 RepID=A0A292PT16_9PEZI|nr:unnamed protein product [Tuber aestivum]